MAYIAKIVVYRTQQPEQDQELVEALDSLFASWRMSGRVLGDILLTSESAETYSSFVMIPDQDALEQQYDNIYVKADFERIAANANQPPVIEILGRDPSSAEVCSCQQSSLYVLYSYDVALESPLRCGDCGQPVPLYRIPYTYHDEEFFNIIAWNSSYQACDKLYMNSYVLEKEAEAQLFRLESDLGSLSKEVCRSISAASGVACYPFIQTSEHEGQHCPFCNGELVDCSAQDAPWKALCHSCQCAI